MNVGPGNDGHEVPGPEIGIEDSSRRVETRSIASRAPANLPDQSDLWHLIAPITTTGINLYMALDIMHTVSTSFFYHHE